MSALLEVENLRVEFPGRGAPVRAVREVGFHLEKGERLGLVGESGSGKTTVGRALLSLIRPPGRIWADRMSLDGTSLLRLSPDEARKIRGRRAAMVMQDPKFSLNPVMSAGRQISESFMQMDGVRAREAREKTMKMLESVRIRDPSRVFNLYPHELSGGMGQRVMLAMMLAQEPELLIADEPTSALDVTVRVRALGLLDELASARGMGVLFISHDLNLVASFCDRVIVMRAGRLVETCEAARLFEAEHPYTRGLLAALPSLENPVERLVTAPRANGGYDE